MKITKIVILTIVLSSCSKVNEYVELYTIKKGNHISTYKIKGLTSNNLDFKACFDNSAIYQTKEIDNQKDINKLYGLSDCNTTHHNNSARFGWRWLENKLEIHAYVYRNKIRSSKFIKYIELNRYYNYSILIKNEYYIFKVDGVEVKIKREKNCDIGYYYYLYPYFGGNEKAPHDIKIVIKKDRTR